jgi:HNH endonuclease
MITAKVLAKFKLEQLSDRVPTPCMLWQGWKSEKGYGQITVPNSGGKTTSIHRAMFLHFKGPIPEGLVLDHICRIRHCGNPDHLEFKTSGDNTRCGDTWKVNGLKTHCRNGHEFTPENTMLEKTRRGGEFHRSCRTCKRAHRKRWADANPDKVREQWKRHREGRATPSLTHDERRVVQAERWAKFNQNTERPTQGLDSLAKPAE